MFNYLPPYQERLYVTNEQAAESYLMTPNSFVILWDANKSVFYEKRTDQNGRPFPLRKFEFHEVLSDSQSEEKALHDQFVTKEELNAIIAKLTTQKEHTNE